MLTSAIISIALRFLVNYKQRYELQIFGEVSLYVPTKTRERTLVALNFVQTLSSL